MFSQNPDIQKLQKKELDMLKYFHEICEKHHLTYYICGGTLIGAVRERGFIPWDDDIDIMMPRKDYEWLLENRTRIFQDQYYLYDYRVDEKENNPRRVPALCDKSIEILHKRGNEERKQYLLLDIFVLDGMPKGSFRRNLHYTHYWVWHMLLQLSWYDITVNQHRANRNIVEKFTIWILNHVKIRPKWDSQKLVRKENDVLRKYDWNHSDYVCSLLGPCHKKEILSRKFFLNSVPLEFENLVVNAPGEYHALLTHYYGNYMVPPARIEEKELHHRLRILGENNK
jgi:lipopolysaccharide cholinephosphotransferase